MKPYVGIAAVTTKSEVEKLTEAFLDEGFSRDATYQGMIGFCVDPELEAAAASRYVDPRQLDGLIPQDNKFGLVSIHYIPQVSEDDIFEDGIKSLFSCLANPQSVDVLQINHALARVKPQEMHAIKKNYPWLKIVIQVGKKELNDSTDLLLDRLESYAPFVDGFLIDPSQGQGEEIAINDGLINKIKALEVNFPNTHFTFAGGLSPSNVFGKVRELSSAVSRHFSIDVESSIRDAGADRLNLQRAGNFINETAKAFVFQ